MILSKNEFVKIIERLDNYNELQNKINDMFKELIDNKEQDFTNAGSICIGHETIVVGLLEKIFNTDLISWWIYEMNYGRDFKIGYFTDNEIDIDLSTAEKLYDYLIHEVEERNNDKY